MTPEQVVGKINKCQSFDRTNQEDIKYITKKTGIISGDYTISFWINFTTQSILPDNPSSPLGQPFEGILTLDGYGIEFLKTYHTYGELDNNYSYINFASYNGTNNDCITSIPINTGTWHFIVGRFIASTKTMTIWVDGILSNTIIQNEIFYGGTINNIYFGRRYNITNYIVNGISIPGEYYNGLLDEVRIALTAHSDAWIKFEFYNINSITNELSLGTQEVAYNGFSYRKKISISTTNLDETLYNFPLYIPITDTEIINNCLINQNDIRFGDINGVLFEYEKQTIGHFWTKITTLTPTTEFYIYYGKSSAIDESSALTWDGYIGVYHLDESGYPYLDSSPEDNRTTQPIETDIRTILEEESKPQTSFITSHTKWAKPYALGKNKICTFVAGTQFATSANKKSTARISTELLQRFDLDINNIYWSVFESPMAITNTDISNSSCYWWGDLDWSNYIIKYGSERIETLLSDIPDCLLFLDLPLETRTKYPTATVSSTNPLAQINSEFSDGISFDIIGQINSLLRLGKAIIFTGINMTSESGGKYSLPGLDGLWIKDNDLLVYGTTMANTYIYDGSPSAKLVILPTNTNLISTYEELNYGEFYDLSIDILFSNLGKIILWATNKESTYNISIVEPSNTFTNIEQKNLVITSSGVLNGINPTIQYRIRTRNIIVLDSGELTFTGSLSAQLPLLSNGIYWLDVIVKSSAGTETWETKQLTVGGTAKINSITLDSTYGTTEKTLLLGYIRYFIESVRLRI